MFSKVAVTTWRIIVAGAAFVAVTLVVYVCWAAIEQPRHVGIRIILRAGVVCGGVDGDGLYDGFLSHKKAQNEEASLTAMSVIGRVATVVSGADSGFGVRCWCEEQIHLVGAAPATTRRPICATEASSCRFVLQFSSFSDHPRGREIHEANRFAGRSKVRYCQVAG